MIRCRDGILGWFTSHMLQVLTYGYVSGSPPKAFYIHGDPQQISATLPSIMVWAPFWKPKNRFPGPQRNELITEDLQQGKQLQVIRIWLALLMQSKVHSQEIKVSHRSLMKYNGFHRDS